MQIIKRHTGRGRRERDREKERNNVPRVAITIARVPD